MNNAPGVGSETEPIVSLVARLFAGFAKLAGQEAALAGVEIKKKLVSLGIGFALLFVAAFLGIAIVATLTACLILAFALVVAPWLAALIVTAIYAILALILILVARSAIVKAMPPVPNQTIATIKENIAWAKRLPTSSKI